MNKKQLEKVKKEDVFNYAKDDGIIGADNIYIYYFDDPEKASDQEIEDICNTVGPYMQSVYFAEDPYGVYHELAGSRFGGYVKCNLWKETIETQKQMLQLFLYGDANPELNRIFLFKDKKRLNAGENVFLDANMVVMAPILDVRAVGFFSKGIDLELFFKCL
ncbi:hypothetical protein [Listeria kieliensis]|nr:hypothetical protein [Listeria kieliensis]